MRTYSALLMIMIAAILLGACDLSAPAEPPAAGTIDGAPAEPTGESSASSITITFGAIGFMRHVYEPLIDAFNTQHPNITVQFVSLDGVYRSGADYDEQTRQIVSRADTAEAGVNEQEFSLGLLRDLKPLIDADPDFNRDDFYPSALSSATAAGGAIYKLPQSLEVALLFYNKDLWAKRGLAAPSPDWSWQDLEAAAQQLARKQGDTVDIYGLADDDVYLKMLLTELRGAGLDLLTAAPDSVHLDRPEVVAALDRMANLFKSGALYYPPQGADWRDLVAQMIVKQKVGMWSSMSAADLAKSGGSSLSFAVGAAPYPASLGSGKDFSRGFVMSSGTQHPNEAWAWLSFLSKQLIADQGGKGGPVDAVSMLPARKSLAERSGYWSHLDDETKAAIQVALARSAPSAGSGANSLEVYEPLAQAVQDIIGGKPASRAASEAQAAIASRVAQAQLTPTVTPAAAPVVVATPVPNAAAPGATTISFGIALGKGGDQVSQLVQQFNQANPSVFVQLKDTFTGDGMMALSDIAAQTDCFVSPLPPAQSELTATLDLQPLIDADSNFNLDDYPAALLTPYQQGGQLHGLPWGIIFRVLVYNKDAFDAAGLPLPTGTWTLDDFLNAAQKLTSGSGDAKQYGFVIPRSQSEAGKFLVHLFGAKLAQGSGETLKPSYTDPSVVQAARKVIDLLRNSSPHTRLNDYPQNEQQIDYGGLTSQGRAGMWFAWGLYAYGPQPQFTMAMAPPPLAQSALDADDISTTSMYISARTDKQQACWAWLKYFSTNTIGGLGGFPARRSVAQSGVGGQGAPAVYDAYLHALERAVPLPPGGESPGTPPIDYFWFYRAIDHALQGKDLERELATAQALTEQYVACVRGGGQRQFCDQQVDPNYGQY
jgi:multiple sugar transport system substrate-binding protein